MFVVGRRKSREAPLGCGFVEPFPGPLHDHEGSAWHQHGLDPVEEAVDIVDVVERRARDHGIEFPRRFEFLERASSVGGTVGRGWVDTDGVVAVAEQRGNEAAKPTAAELEHRGWRGWQLAADEWPGAGEPRVVDGHP